MSKSYVRARSVLAVVLLIAAAISVALTFALWPSTPSEAQVPAVVKKIDLGKASARGGAVSPAAGGSLTNNDAPTTSGSGRITFEVKNTSNENATDLHFKIVSPAGATATVVGTSAPLSTISGDGTGEVEVAMPNGGNPLGHGATQTVGLEFKDEQGNKLEQKKVHLQIWWTKFGDAMVMLSPDKVGGNVLVSLDIPDFDASTKEIQEGTDEFVASDIAIGENYGYRFETGDLMLSLNRGLTFTDISNLELLAYDEDGNSMANNPDDISFGTPRLTVLGSLVIPIHRNASHNKHVAVIIRNATVSGSDILSVDETVRVRVSCSALAGMVVEDWQTLATIIPEEE